MLDEFAGFQPAVVLRRYGSMIQCRTALLKLCAASVAVVVNWWVPADNPVGLAVKVFTPEAEQVKGPLSRVQQIVAGSLEVSVKFAFGENVWLFSSGGELIVVVSARAEGPGAVLSRPRRILKSVEVTSPLWFRSATVSVVFNRLRMVA